MDQSAQMPIVIKCERCSSNRIQLSGMGYDDGWVWDVFQCLTCGERFEGSWMESVSDTLFMTLTEDERVQWNQANAAK